MRGSRAKLGLPCRNRGGWTLILRVWPRLTCEFVSVRTCCRGRIGLNALLHCNFLRNWSLDDVARQDAGELQHSMGCLAICFCCATDCSNWQHLGTVYNPFSNSSCNFTAILTRAHAHTPRLLFRRVLPRPSLAATSTFPSSATEVAEKIAQCNRPFYYRTCALGLRHFFEKGRLVL